MYLNEYGGKMMKQRKWIAALLALTLSVSMISNSAGSIVSAVEESSSAGTKIVGLETNSRTNPQGLDDASPVFGWKMESNIIGQQQRYYQIFVFDEDGNSVWDSGKKEDAASAYIEYGGSDLQPKTDYSWYVKVWDKFGNEYLSDTATFSTALMDTTLAAWNGAEWIGSDIRTFDADTLAVYRISYDVQLQTGDSAGFVFGANDPRLNDWMKNNYLIEGENYVEIELDIAGLYDQDPATAATVNVLRKGYCPQDQEQTDGITVVKSIPLDGSYGYEMTADNARDTHTFSLSSIGNDVRIAIDGIDLKDQNSGGGGFPGFPGSQSGGTQIIINPLGKTQDVPCYPRVNDIGFATGENTRAVFSNLKIKHYNEPNATIFDQNTGASYSIFQNLDGMRVNGSRIQVQPGTLGWADPSYGSSPMMRTTFHTDASKEIKSAKVYATAHGIYEMYINGERVGDSYFAPGYTQYDATLNYSVYDITDLLQQDNAIGVWLSSGWWSDAMTCENRFYNWFGDSQDWLMNLEITYTDGTTQTVVSNTDDWKCYFDGPITYSGFFNGEDYDSSREEAVEGWTTYGYDDFAWLDVVEPEVQDWVAEPQLVAQSNDPVRIVQTIDTIDHFDKDQANTYYSQPKEGEDVYIYDMGTNMAGIPQITLPEMKEGTEITIRYAEMLYPELADDNPYNYGDLEGMILTENLRAAYVTDTYICKGTPGGEVIQPRFTFHGYRYIEITGAGGPLPQESIKGLVLSSIGDTSLSYESSNPLANQLSDNIMRSLYGNHISIPTDCPQRDERMGWAGDAAVFSRTATYFADMSSFYQHWGQTMRDSQNKGTGEYSNSPNAQSKTPSDPSNYDKTKISSSVCWPSTGILPAWECYLQYGNTAFLEEHYDSMLNYMEGVTDDHNLQTGCEYLINGSGLSEHLALVNTDSNYCQNVVAKYLCDVMAEIAMALGDTETAERYAARSANMKAEFNTLCIDPETGKTRSISGAIQDTEASYALAFEYDMISQENYDKAVDNYASACEAGLNGVPYTITTGFYGTGKVLPGLTKAGLVDEAYKMFEQTEYASWLYPVVQGATSIWERWNGYTIENGFGGNNGMNSFNHYAAGAVGQWMVNYQIGITNDQENPGFQHFILQPTPGGNMTYTNGSYDSYYGTIVSNWTADNGTLTSYEAVIPANSSATLYLPVSEEVMQNFTETDGMTYKGMTTHNNNPAAEFELVAGGYTFTVADGKLTASVSDGYVVPTQADKTILDQVIAYAQLQKADPSFETVIAEVQTSFNAALANAIEVEQDSFVDQETVDNAWITLMREIHKLGFVVGDTTSLEKLMAVAEEIEANLQNYVEKGKSEFLDALAAARALIEDKANAMSDEIERTSKNLLDAIMELRLKADKTLLAQIITQAASVDLSGYTAETIEVFHSANDTANKVYQDDNATQQEVDAAVTGLRDAIQNLNAKEAAAETAMQGDQNMTANTSNSKTGETSPIALSLTLFALAGACVVLGKKKR